MASIVVEREFTTPRTRDDILAMIGNNEQCLGLYGATDVVHYLSTDGLRLTCVFEAPDAEALRRAGRVSGFSDPSLIWTANVHAGADFDGVPEPPDPGNAIAVVERSFPEPVRFEDLEKLERDNCDCLERNRVRSLTSYVSSDRRRVLSLYEAPDVEAVRAVNRATGLPFDIAWGTQVIAPPPP